MILLGSRPHQRHLRIVLVESAPLELLRHRLRLAPKFTISRQPGASITVGMPACAAASIRVDPPAPRTPPTNSSAHSVVVRSSTLGDQSARDQRFHGAPARARRVKDEHLEPRTSRRSSLAALHAGRGVPKHRLGTTMRLSAPAWLSTAISTMPQSLPPRGPGSRARGGSARPHRRSKASSRYPSRPRTARYSRSPACCDYHLRKPMASARIAAVAMAVPPLPPRAMTPST